MSYFETLTMVLPPRSPKKMANGAVRVACCHDPLEQHTIMVEGPDSCFGTDQLNQWEKYPKKCTGCNQPFKKGWASKGDTTHTMVNLGRPTLFCQNALNHRDQDCVHCHCMDCKAKAIQDAPEPKRARREQKALNPGEVRLPNGDITAAG